MFIRELPSINGIKIGRLFFKPSNAESVLARSVRLVALGTRASDRTIGWPFGRSGSCTLVAVGDSYYVVTTRHELDIPRGVAPEGVKLDNVMFCSPHGTLRNIAVDRCYFETSNPDEEYHDLLLFHVSHSWSRLSEEKVSFFRVQGDASRSSHVCVAIGHPTDREVIDYDGNIFNFRTATLTCKLDAEFQSKNSHYRRYEYKEREVNLDGFSGGAVFSIVGEVDEMEAVLDGIIVRAGAGSIYAVGSQFIKDLHKKISESN
jgi:hypothetical protein